MTTTTELCNNILFYSMRIQNKHTGKLSLIISICLWLWKQITLAETGGEEVKWLFWSLEHAKCCLVSTFLLFEEKISEFGCAGQNWPLVSRVLPEITTSLDIRPVSFLFWFSSLPPWRRAEVNLSMQCMSLAFNSLSHWGGKPPQCTLSIYQ